jgi:transcription elongation factor GreB
VSKAFTGESDDEDPFFQAPATLPVGVRNYMTPAGAKRFSVERENLLAERSRLQSGNFEHERRRRAIDHRLQFLSERLDALQVIDPAQQTPDQIRFGARVTIQSVDGEEEWRIVGIDETDLEKGDISWMSPLAAALLERRVGEQVEFQGRTMTVKAIRYVP